MKAYRTYLTITESKQVVLTDVPFQPGERVEVLLLTSETTDRDMSQELTLLFKETQSLLQIRVLSDEDIAAEVAAYRNGQ